MWIRESVRVQVTSVRQGACVDARLWMRGFVRACAWTCVHACVATCVHKHMHACPFWKGDGLQPLEIDACCNAHVQEQGAHIGGAPLLDGPDQHRPPAHSQAVRKKWNVSLDNVRKRVDVLTNTCLCSPIQATPHTHSSPSTHLCMRTHRTQVLPSQGPGSLQQEDCGS